MELLPIYGGVAGVVGQASKLLQCARLHQVQKDEVVYAGGSACLPGVHAALVVRLRKDVITLLVTGIASGELAGKTNAYTRRLSELFTYQYYRPQDRSVIPRCGWGRGGVGRPWGRMGRDIQLEAEVG
jgi:hypothetical protein